MPDLCSACQYCWRRKIKCVLEGDTCKACQLAGITCTPRTRGQIGRPRGSRKHTWRIPTPVKRAVTKTRSQSSTLPVTSEALASGMQSYLGESVSGFAAAGAALPSIVQSPTFSSLSQFLELQGAIRGFTRGEGDENELLTVLESVCESVGGVRAHPAQDVLLQFIILTRAIDAAEHVFHRSASTQGPFDTTDPTFWQELDLLTASASFPDLAHEFVPAARVAESQQQLAVLTRLDAVLAVLAQAQQQLSRSLLSTIHNMDARPPALRDKLVQQIEQCLSQLQATQAQVNSRLQGLRGHD